MRSISLLFSLLFVLFFTQPILAYESYEEKELKVSLRMVGHRLLLSAKDSTSLVLPLQQVGNQYQISFDTEFAFEPDSLIDIIEKVLISSGKINGYIAEVEDCHSKGIIYSYQVGMVQKQFKDDPSANSGNEIDGDVDTESSTGITMIPCRTRFLPESCYTIILTLDRRSMQSKDGSAEDEEESFLFALICLILFVGITLFVFIAKRRLQNQSKEHMIRLGKFHFDKHKAELIIEEQRTELSGKESELLLLLYDSVNETVEREVILNKVWGDEGDYIGRTLDVFISKLRKKLEADPTIKITNVRGVGYRLVLED